METFVDKFVTFAQKLPGFGLAFLLATLAYMYLKGDYTKLLPVETFVTAVLCWLLYHVASYLDKLYDTAYGPKSKLRFLWGSDKLKKSRDRAAKALFEPIDHAVKDYAYATAKGHIGERPLLSLYSLCSTLAKPTDTWRKKIEPKIDISKAARTVFAFAAIAALITKIPSLQDSLGVTLYIERLGIFANMWVHCVIAFVALFVYVALRILHNLELYDLVATRVKHLPIGDVTAAVIFEVTLPKQSRA